MIDAVLQRAFDGPGFPRRHVADLRVRSGRILGCDPLTQPDGPPFVVEVPAGDHPVVLLNGSDGAVVVFGRERPVRWELALVPGQDAATLAPGHIFGYMVDTGVGAFVDAEGARLWEAELDAIDGADGADDPLDSDQFDEHGFHSHLIGSAAPRVANPAGYNVVAFRAGYGDGTYATYVGLDGAGTPVCLLTDFALS